MNREESLDGLQFDYQPSIHDDIHAIATIQLFVDNGQRHLPGKRQSCVL